MTDDETLPTPEQILAAHEAIEDEYDMKYTGTRVAAPKLKLKRILRDVHQDDVYHRAAFLLRKLITAHLFEDGNKRTGWAVTVKYLDRNGEAPARHGEDVEKVLKRIRRYNVDEIAEWLEMGEIDESRLGS